MVHLTLQALGSDIKKVFHVAEDASLCLMARVLPELFEFLLPCFLGVQLFHRYIKHLQLLFEIVQLKLSTNEAVLAAQLSQVDGVLTPFLENASPLVDSEGVEDVYYLFSLSSLHFYI